MADDESLNTSHLPPPNPNPCPTPHTPPETRESANHKAEMEQKKKVVVVMGASGTGKSRLAIDMASLFPFGFAFEVVNADSMQVYRGLDVLTNKVPLHDQKGVPHHLLGTVDANVEFSARDFRDLAVPIIDDILARGRIPVIAGGTNYYIQALVSPYLMDEMVSEMDECCISDGNEESRHDFQSGRSDGESNSNYDCLKKLDPVAANRIHPNDQRKSQIRDYLQNPNPSNKPHHRHRRHRQQHRSAVAAPLSSRANNAASNCSSSAAACGNTVAAHFSDRSSNRRVP